MTQSAPRVRGTVTRQIRGLGREQTKSKTRNSLSRFIFARTKTLFKGGLSAKAGTQASLALESSRRRAHLLSRGCHFSNSFLHQTEMHVIQTDKWKNKPNSLQARAAGTNCTRHLHKGWTPSKTAGCLAAVWLVLHINYGMGIAPRWFRAGIRESHAIWQYMSDTQAQTNSHSRLN